ncbi:MAG TPA: hypothetical protein VL485_09370 [Ktedonobacteraceae bacterium]|nr:hypothetical protein [Ktedonobacteraceae bacterium]
MPHAIRFRLTEQGGAAVYPCPRAPTGPLGSQVDAYWAQTSRASTR